MNYSWLYEWIWGNLSLEDFNCSLYLVALCCSCACAGIYDLRVIWSRSIHHWLDWVWLLVGIRLVCLTSVPIEQPEKAQGVDQCTRRGKKHLTPWHQHAFVANLVHCHLIRPSFLGGWHWGVSLNSHDIGRLKFVINMKYCIPKSADSMQTTLRQEWTRIFS